VASKTIRIPYEMEPKQRDFHKAVLEHDTTGFASGRGGGKTYAGAMELIRHGLSLMPGATGIIGAPTYKDLRDPVQKTILEHLPSEAIVNFNKSDNVMELKNGTQWLFRSADNPASYRGPNADYGWGDELSYWPYEAIMTFLATLRGTGKVDRSQVRAWFTMTPKGDMRIKQLFERDGATLIYGSSMDNTKLTDQFLAMLKSSYTGKFYEQEVLGQWVKMEGLVYDMIEDSTHQLERPVSEMVRFCAGVDWGYEHPWVLVIAGQDEAGRWHFFEEVHQSHLNKDQQIDLVLDLMRRYALERVYCPDDDPEGIEMYIAAGIPATRYVRTQGKHSNVIPGIQAVASMLALTDGRAGCTFSAAVPKTYSELKQYQWRKRPEGTPGKEEPLKVNDHGPDAVRALLHGEKQQDPGSQEIFLIGDWGDLD